MLSDKTVVLGEASESDSEEISLGNDKQTVVADEQNVPIDKSEFGFLDSDAMSAQHYQTRSRGEMIKSQSKTGGLGSSLLASIGPTSALGKLVSSYNFLTSNATLTPSIPTTSRSAVIIMEPSRIPKDSQLSLLHKTLYVKNQQLYACLNHIFKHPYEKAFADLHSISHRLVGIQKIIQDVNSDVLKMKRELKNLDFKPKMIF